MTRPLNEKLDVETTRLGDSRGEARIDTTADSFCRYRSFVGEFPTPMHKMTQNPEYPGQGPHLGAVHIINALFALKSSETGMKKGLLGACGGQRVFWCVAEAL